MVFGNLVNKVLRREAQDKLWDLDYGDEALVKDDSWIGDWKKKQQEQAAKPLNTYTVDKVAVKAHQMQVYDGALNFIRYEPDGENTLLAVFISGVLVTLEEGV